MNKKIFILPTSPNRSPNLNFFLYEKYGHEPEPTPIHTEVRFEHGRQGIRVGTLKGIATPIDLMMSTTAKDRLGFPTHRKIIDAEFTMEGFR